MAKGIELRIVDNCDLLHASKKNCHNLMARMEDLFHDAKTRKEWDEVERKSVLYKLLGNLIDTKNSLRSVGLNTAVVDNKITSTLAKLSN